MALFKFGRNKKQESNTTPQIESAEKRSQDIIKGNFNADEAYERSMSYWEEQDRKRAEEIQQFKGINHEIMGRISQLEALPGRRLANDMARETAEELAKHLKQRETAEEYLETKLKKLELAGFPKSIIDEQRKNYTNHFTEHRLKGYSEDSFKSLVDKCLGWVDDPKMIEQQKQMLETQELLETYLAKLQAFGFPKEKIDRIREEIMNFIRDGRKQGFSEKDIQQIYLEASVGRLVNNVPLIQQEIQDTLDGINTPEELLEIYLTSLHEQGVSDIVISKLRENELGSLMFARMDGISVIIENIRIKKQIRQEYIKYNDPQIYSASPEVYLETCLARLQEQGIPQDVLETYRQKLLDDFAKSKRLFPQRDDYILNRLTIDRLEVLVAAYNNKKDQVIEEEQPGTTFGR